MVEKFSDGETPVEATSDGETVHLEVGASTHRLTRSEAAQLRDQLADALEHVEEFLHTACRRRDDGSYVVRRRGADSSGHRKVFPSFDACRRLYGRLPDEFTADDVGRTGLTGGRRHMLVHHFAEHPAFDCELVSRQPLTARKRGVESVETANAD